MKTRLSRSKDSGEDVLPNVLHVLANYEVHTLVFMTPAYTDNETNLYYFRSKMRFSMNEAIKDFEEIDCFQVEHTQNPWK